MIRLVAVAFALALATSALALATSAQAMPVAPLHPDGMVTQVRAGCGLGRIRVNGVCVARTEIRQTRRAVRRGYVAPKPATPDTMPKGEAPKQ